ncbi:MAG TPA: molecular chaperone TorD family protein [Burkholderiales bacterium]|nr:molecular chaperone TorD family protein [Burkholderiales bacterium]
MSEAGSERAAASSPETEEQGRANLYGLVSRLFYGPPDPNLLAEISRGEPGADGQEGDGELVAAWRVLQEACRGAYPAIVRQEYDSLFVGVGKAPVTPYLSAYAEPNSPDRYLVRLRQQLVAWGLARRQSVFEVEDHVSGLSDVMRWLIEAQRPLADQRSFFKSFMYPGIVPFLAAVQHTPLASLYKLVAVFSLSFVELEKAAFEMDEGE